MKAPRQIIDVGVVRCAESPVGSEATASPAPSHGAAVVVVQPDRRHGTEYKQLLIQIEHLYSALLDLQSDQLKLSALPTGAPLREQVRSMLSI